MNSLYARSGITRPTPFGEVEQVLSSVGFQFPQTGLAYGELPAIFSQHLSRLSLPFFSHAPDPAQAVGLSHFAPSQCADISE